MNHPNKAELFNKDFQRTTWHDETLWYVRTKRDKAVYSTPDFQKLRDAASAIKDHTLSKLSQYLEEFERNALENGVHVHWASNAEQHNQIILDIIRHKGFTKVVKSKSMLTEECHLNKFLEDHKIEVVDTDLGEHIVQLRKETPSHIVLPAIHLKKEEVAQTFLDHKYSQDKEAGPVELTKIARSVLRKKFMQAEAAITGVNFAIAETGGIVVCTNEGNADLGVNVANVHIASMGIEKVIPSFRHLSVFTRLLARSATGQAITTYTSHFRRPAKGKELHIVIVDNGRSEQLARDDFRASLKCIRCGACMNTCPVYRRSGGHSYDFTVPGPIGSILSPNIDLTKHSSLPFASTLCGSCSAVCPVKIDIHVQLYKWRQVMGSNNVLPTHKKTLMHLMAKVFANERLYRLGGFFFRKALKYLPYSWTHSHTLNPWAKSRDLPKPPAQTFNSWFKQQSKNE